MPSHILFQSKLLITLEPLAEIKSIKARWQQIEKYRSSVFLSWSWIGSWLASIKDKTNVYAICFYNSNNELVGMAFLVKEKIRRRKLFTLNVISLNETTTENTQFIIEYNNILHKHDYREDIFFSFFDFLKNGPLKFDELQLHSFDDKNSPEIEVIANSSNLNYLREKTSEANFVDFAGFSNDPDNYIKMLSKNKREQIRRSIRYFEHYGEMKMEVASNETQALEFFDAMAKLHQPYWTSKGYSGSFANKNWVEFHKHLITNHLNNVQFIKLSYGDYIIGYLYNFIDTNAVYSIQSGFNYGKEKNNRPGLILHFYAIRHAISNNLLKYDFLVGDTQYKRSLSNSQNSNSWIQIQNYTFIIIMENISVKCVRILKYSIKIITTPFLRSQN